MTEALGDDGIGAFPVPGGERTDGKPAVVKGGWQAFVNAKSAHVDEAKAFTKWLWVDNLDGSGGLVPELRLPHPAPQEPGGQGREAAVRSRPPRA